MNRKIKKIVGFKVDSWKKAYQKKDLLMIRGFRSFWMKELDSEGRDKGLHWKKEAQDDGSIIFRGKSTYCRSMGCWMV